MILSGKGDGPVVTSVNAAYLQRNQRPVVSGLVVHPPGVVFQKPFSTGEAEIAGYEADVLERRLANQGQPAPSTGAPTLGRRTYQKGLQTLVWKGDDANGDDLTFDVSYRREGDTAWKTLATALADPIYVWDTAAVPSGTYVVRIAASDAPSQAAGSALVGELESPVIEVDNTPPALTAGAVTRDGGRIVVTLEVRDDQSAVSRLEYSIDGRSWLPAYPADGLLDGRRESVTLRLEPDAAGRTLVVRAADALHNVGTTSVVLALRRSAAVRRIGSLGADAPRTFRPLRGRRRRRHQRTHQPVDIGLAAHDRGVGEQPHHAHGNRRAAGARRLELRARRRVEHRQDHLGLHLERPGLLRRQHLDALDPPFPRHHRRQREHRVLAGQRPVVALVPARHLGEAVDPRRIARSTPGSPDSR